MERRRAAPPAAQRVVLGAGGRSTRRGTGRAVGRGRDERGLRGTRVAGGAGGWVEPNLAWLS